MTAPTMTEAQRKEIAYMLERAAQKAREGVLDWIALELQFLDGARNSIRTQRAPRGPIHMAARKSLLPPGIEEMARAQNEANNAIED